MVNFDYITINRRTIACSCKTSHNVICYGESQTDKRHFLNLPGNGPPKLAIIFSQPARILQNYQRKDLTADILASLTVAVIMLPQAIAYALIAELPPQTGLYAAIVATIIGALWGSSNHLHTGPTNTTSLVVLSTLLSLSVLPGSPDYVAAAAMMALLVGIVPSHYGFSTHGDLCHLCRRLSCDWLYRRRRCIDRRWSSQTSAATGAIAPPLL